MTEFLRGTEKKKRPQAEQLGDNLLKFLGETATRGPIGMVVERRIRCGAAESDCGGRGRPQPRPLWKGASHVRGTQNVKAAGRKAWPQGLLAGCVALDMGSN